MFRFIFPLCLILCASPVVAETLQNRFEDLESFSQAIEVIESQGMNGTSHKKLIDQAISGMLNAQDPYSRLLDASELEELKKTSAGQSFGIGLSLEKKGDQLLVTRVAPGSPGAKAGIKRGDQLLSVLGKPASEFDLNEVQRAKAPVDIEWSPGHKAALSKAWYPNTGVKFFSPVPNVLVIQLDEFFTETAQLIRQKLEQTQPKSVVIDLRDNPGGLVFSAVEVAELFVSPGLIIETRDRAGKSIESFVARKQPVLPHAKVVVLINHNSASAAEILVQSLKENHAALVFGETSYGKGVVQSLFPLGHGRYAMMTMAQYFGPSGESFHQVGIAPDVALVDTWGAVRYSHEDLIYTKALASIKAQP